MLYAVEITGGQNFGAGQVVSRVLETLGFGSEAPLIS